MSEVVNACSKKWSDKDKCYLCECDSNWITNMYLDYTNNYLNADTFAQNEVLDFMELNGNEIFGSDVVRYRSAVKALINLFSSVGFCQPMLNHERVGEICIKILKGEF